MGCDIHKLISNPFGDAHNWKLLDLQQVFSSPTEGFALGMTTCRTSGTTGKSNFRYQNTVFFYTTRCISNFLSNFRIRIFASCDIYHFLSQWVMKIPLFCQQMAKEWYFLLAKHCLQEFKLDCQLRRLTDRTIKGYYNNALADSRHGLRIIRYRRHVSLFQRIRLFFSVIVNWKSRVIWYNLWYQACGVWKLAKTKKER